MPHVASPGRDGESRCLIGAELVGDIHHVKEWDFVFSTMRRAQEAGKIVPVEFQIIGTTFGEM